ncbi:YjbF family lipoprotein [uncultured Oceanisphaera sp.]|uniref:YjbF family lipoprotein n=1 Tax=uncultured Oceanisphaera sp. TaxID=353858 RepID=UPI00261A2BAA|nr:YjbF family lipoprotein [uncultured Oceanisphaera sp.]
MQDISDTLRVAALGYNDVPLTRQQITALPYAAIQLKWGHGPRVLSVLALAEGDKLKWVTQDKKMLVTQHGRLIKTLGFEQNLVYTGNLAADPLPHLLTLLQQRQDMRWASEQDWQPGYISGYASLSRFEYQGEESQNILGQPVTLIKFTEQVRYAKFDRQLQNTFWLSPDSGEVIKSRQFIGPGLPEVEITLIKPYQS